MEYLWWVYAVSTVIVLLVTAGVLVYKRESRRVEVKLQETDEAKEELLDDFRGRAVKRIQQMNQLRKSPSKLKLALSQYLQNRRAYNKVVADSRLEKGDGMRSLYTQPDDVQSHPLVPLVRPSHSSAEDDDDAQSALFGLRRPKNPSDEALLRRRAFAFKTLKHNFDFLNPEQLAALSFDATELRISRGDVLVTEGSKVETPSLYIVESGVLECTCDGGKPLAKFAQGDLVASLFSLTATMVGVGIHSYTTVRAVRDSVLIRLCPQASRMAKLDDSALQEIVRMCAVRLYHVTIMTLGKFLGLTNELFVAKAKVGVNIKSCSDVDADDPDYPKTPPGVGDDTPRFNFESDDDDGDDDSEAEQVSAVDEGGLSSMFDAPDGGEAAVWKAARSAVAAALCTSEELLPAEPQDGCGLSVHRYDGPVDIVSKGDAPALYVVLKGSLLVYADPEGESYDRSADSFTNSASPRASSTGFKHGKHASRHTDVAPVPKELQLLTCSRGDFFGSISLITQEEFDQCARTAERGTTLVARVDHLLFDQMASQEPALIRALCRHMLGIISPLVQQLGYAISWVEAKNGDLILREGDASDSVLVIVYGRLRAVPRKRKHRIGAGASQSAGHEFSGDMGIGTATPGPASSLDFDAETGNASWRHLGSVASGLSQLGATTDSVGSPRNGPNPSAPMSSGGPAAWNSSGSQAYADPTAQQPREFGFGDVVGAQEFLSGERHHVSVCAVRSSQLARIPGAVFHHTARKFPHVWSHFCRYVFGLRTRRGPSHGEQHRSVLTVAVVPIVDDVPIDYFCDKLHAGLEIIGKSTLLDGGEATLASRFRTSRSTPSATPLASPASKQDKEGDSMKARADDKLLRRIVAQAQRQENLTRRLSQLEQQNMHLIFKIKKPHENRRWTRAAVANADIVLLVGQGSDSPAVSASERLVSSLNANAQFQLVLLHENPGPDDHPHGTGQWLKRRAIQQHYHIRYYPGDPDRDLTHFKSDFHRLARYLVGRAFGLVLSGGGARGNAHVGVVQALEENQIPVDMVGGTSMGAFAGGLYAHSPTYEALRKKGRRYSHYMSSIRNLLFDLTVPMVSYFTGKNFNRGLIQQFGGVKIEDLWIPFFCMSTDLTDQSARVHRNGTLWRYCSASMRLLGYFPPICDTITVVGDDGNAKEVVHYLVDGGYVNNLPTDIMSRDPRVGCVIGVDVGGFSVFSGYNYGDHLSGSWALLNLLNPINWCRKNKQKYPGYASFTSQLTYVSGDGSWHDLSQRHCDLYLRPPIDSYGITSFSKFREIKQKGYVCAKTHLSRWADTPSGHFFLRHLKRERIMQRTKSFLDASSLASAGAGKK